VVTVSPFCRCLRAALPVMLLAGCHDWTTDADHDADVPGDVAEDGESPVDAPDAPDVRDAPDVPGDSREADVREDDGGDDVGTVEDAGTDRAEPDGDVPGDVGDAAGAVCGNGVREPGEDCETGTSVACTTDCGSTGTASCPDDCRVPPPAACPAPAEVCNGRDDDCNGRADDGRRVCPGCDVVERGSGVYHFCEDAVSWESASATCRARGMYLTTIDDGAENDWLIRELLSRASATTWWIGFNDRAVEGGWVWDGPPPTDPSFSGWCAGEPNDHDGVEDCAEIPFLGSCWNDAGCSAARPYVCESR